MKKRLFPALLALVMVLGMLPGTALADATPLTSVSITGTPQVGKVLTAVVDPTEAEDTSTFQWKSANAATGPFTNIGGANESTYTLTEAEEGKYIQVEVTGDDTNYSGTVTSTDEVGPVAGEDDGATTPPTISSGTFIAFSGNGSVEIPIGNAGDYQNDITVTVYDANGNAITNGSVEGSYSSGKIILTFTPALARATTYGIAFTEEGKSQSTPVSVTVEPFVLAPTTPPVVSGDNVTADPGNETAEIAVTSPDYEGDVTVKVYTASGTTLADGVTGVYSKGAIILTFDPALATTTTYYVSLTEAGKSESEKVKVTVSPYLNITDVGEAKSESSTGATGKQSMVTTVTLDKDDVEKAAKESDVLAIGEEKALAEGDEFAEVRVSKDGFKLLADAEKPVDVKTSRGSIRLPVDDVKALADLPVENIVFDIGVEQEAGDDLDTDEINASKMVEIDLTDGEGGNLAEAGNGLGLSLAVTLKTDMAEPQEGRAAAVWYLDGDNLDDQELLYFDGAKDGEDGEISWTATHFSTYIFGSKIVVNPPRWHGVSRSRQGRFHEERRSLCLDGYEHRVGRQRGAL